MNKELLEKKFQEYKKNMEWFIIHGRAAMDRLAREELLNPPKADKK